MDFTYRGVRVEDIWPSGAFWPGSQTQYLHRHREEGGERFMAALPNGDRALTFTEQEMRQAIDMAINGQPVPA